MRAPQVHTRGSTSTIFLSRRAQLLPFSLEKPELCCSECLAARRPLADVDFVSAEGGNRTRAPLGRSRILRPSRRLATT